MLLQLFQAKSIRLMLIYNLITCQRLFQ